MLQTRPHTTLKLHLDLGWGEQMPGQKSIGEYKPQWAWEGVSFHSIIPTIDECQVYFIKLLTFYAHGEFEKGLLLKEARLE